ncbi:MAG: hypothetical protein K0R92_1606 [Lachnospiraceae bacterium]|jgi:heptaprenylglyceryl phosphate synthase|nr:hypothetical protein [Lachnospiraceae bacterium]
MIKWAKNLYLGDTINPKKKDRIMKSIETGKFTFEVYCILFASNPENLFDIMNANELLFPYYSKKELYVVGLALSRIEAFELVKEMIDQVYRETGSFSVRDYFTDES